MKGPLAPYYVPPQLNLPGALAEALAQAAVHSIRASVQAVAHARRPRRGATLKPGRDTPLWNELAAAAEPHLKTYGAKARLARILGVPRQRVHDLLHARRCLPDAERTLLLLVWLQARSEGRDLA